MATNKAVQPIAALDNFAKMTNAELWDAIRKEVPSFASHTAQATAELFTEESFRELSQTDGNRQSIINEFYQLSVRVALQQINISLAKDPLAGFGETYYQPYGGVTQRISVNSIKPISPQYMHLKDGDSIDPFIVRKPTMQERFFGRNFNYQSLVTMQNYPLKENFLNGNGVAQIAAGVARGLLNGWIIQKYENKLECLNSAINDPQLKATQIIETSYDGTWDDTKIRDFLSLLMNIGEAMTIDPQTSAFNSAGFESLQDIGRLRILLRPGFKTALKVDTLYAAFHRDELDPNLKIQTVSNFGGIYYQTTGGQRLYPAYGEKLKDVIGLNEQENQTVATHQKSDPDVVAVDPNADVIGIIADKGFLFEDIANEYRTEGIHNPLGLYDNLIASAPNNGIHYDRLYNFIVLKKKAA